MLDIAGDASARREANAAGTNFTGDRAMYMHGVTLDLTAHLRAQPDRYFRATDIAINRTVDLHHAIARKIAGHIHVSADDRWHAVTRAMSVSF